VNVSGEPTRLERHEGRKRSLKHVIPGATLSAIALRSLLALVLAAAAIWLVRFAVLDLRGENPYRGAGEDPMWVLGAFGFTVTAFAFGTLAESVLLRLRGRRIRAGRARHPGEPWRWDYRWGRGPIRVTGVGYYAANLLGLSIPIAFLSLFNQAALDTWHPLFIVTAVAGDAIVLWALGQCVPGLARSLWQSLTAAVHLDRFPCFLGEPFEVELRGSSFRRSGHMFVELREVEESDKGVFAVYSERRSLAVGDNPLRLRFALPDGGAANRLTVWPHRYWELAVETTVDRWLVFLLPVYERPADRPATP
jgi:hypothetical protein